MLWRLIAPTVTVPAVPPKMALSFAALLHAWNVAPLNQSDDAVSHVPVPPVPAAAPFTSHVRLACACAAGASASIPSNTAAAQTIFFMSALPFGCVH